MASTLKVKPKIAIKNSCQFNGWIIDAEDQYMSP